MLNLICLLWSLLVGRVFRQTLLRSNRAHMVNLPISSNGDLPSEITNNPAIPIFHGCRIRQLPSGDTYEGEWRNGRMHGKGKLTHHLDKSTWEGEFKEGNMWNGSGTIKYNGGGNSGSTYNGPMVDGELHGIGVWTYPDGKFFQGEWCRGERVINKSRHHRRRKN